MKRSVIALVTASFPLFTAAPVFSGPYTDDMARCLVKSTSDTDKVFLVKWMFAAAALHPAVRSISSVSDAERDELNRNTATLFERLVTESCRSEAQEAVKYEGPASIQTSFQVLGHVAAQGLFSDPDVARGLAAADNRIDRRKIEAVFAPAR